MATMSPYAFVHPLSVGLAAAPALAPPSSAEGRRWQAQPAAGNAGAAARCAVPTAAPAAASADAAAAAAAWRVPPRTVAWGPTAPGAGARLQQMSPLFAAGLLDSGGNRRRRRYAPGRKRRMVKALVRYLLTGDRGGAEEFWEGQGSGGGGAADLARLAAVAALGASPAGPIGGGSGGITAEMATTFMSASTSSSSSPSASSPSSLPPSATSSASASLSPAAAARPRVSARMASTTTATPTRPSVARPPPSIADDAILGAEYDDLDEAELTAADAAADAAAGPPLPGERIPLTSRVLKWAFERVIRMRATRVEGLEVFVSAKSNRRALSGDLQTVGINWDALALPQLQITGGAKVQITGVDLKVLFLVWRRFMAFKRPFEVSGYYVFTNSDVVGSPLIRRLVQAMLNATLRKLEDYATDRRAVQRTGINVLRVMIKKSKLVVDGEVVYDKFRVPFNYRTGLGISKRGHVVYLRDPEVFWDNVGGSLTLPLVPLQAFDVDIGDNARIEHIDIRDGRLTVRARFVLSPIPPLVVADVSKRAAFRYDLGERLSISFGGLVDNAFRLF